MTPFLLEITSPEGNLFSGMAVKISLRGTEGELAVMAGHIPFVTYVVPCTLKVELENGEEKKGLIQSGLLTVSKEKVLLLTGEMKWKE